jgi:hypothetical protein
MRAANEQTSELVRELRRIRFILAGILLLLALHFAQVAVQHWADSHYQTSPRSQEFRDSRGELRAVHNDLSNQRNPPPAVVPGEKPASREGKPSE